MKKSVNHMFYRNNNFQEKDFIISIHRVKLVIIKDCHFFNLSFNFIKRNKISKAKVNKEAEIGW